MACFHDIFDEKARLEPSSAAFVCHRPPAPRAELSYSELQVRSRRLAAGLRLLLAKSSQGCSASARKAGAQSVVAVWLPRTHEDFLPVLVAVSRCGATFALMSTDLKDKDLEQSRNVLIVNALQPSLILVSQEHRSSQDVDEVLKSSGMKNLAVVGVESIDGSMEESFESRVASSSPLCFLFTGGTFRCRCAVVTHDMVHHESLRYPEVLPLQSRPRVLANTSVYWGASALGQLSIALAYGGCAVLCEASDPEEIRAVVAAENADVLGLVPDQLRLLAEDPAQELPNLLGIFTWGERLPPAMAERWRGHPRARLRELLISTEYWLAFYSAPLEEAAQAGGKRGLLRVVRGAEILVVDDEGRPSQEGEVGELLLAGPMVTSGYVDLQNGGATPAAAPFREVDGVRYFCTRDLVRRASCGRIEFRGRADMTAKERGKWVDLLAVEEALQSLDGVTEAAMLPDPSGGSEPQGFLVLRAGNGLAAAEVRAAARAVLPRGAQLHILDHLPRHPVTRKVDARRLTAMLKRAGESWPLDPEAPPDPFAARRASEKAKSMYRWTLATMALAATWDAWALARLPLLLSQTRSAVRPTSTLPTMGGFVLLPFMHLAYLHTTDDGARWGLLARLLQELPCGVWGAAFLALLGRGASPPGSMPRKALGLSVGLWAAAGTACALWRGRFLSYPFVFWAGVGHRTHYELERWKQWKNWSWYFESRLELFTDAAGYIAGGSWLGKLVSASAVPSSEAAPASDYAQMANDCCWTCGREVLERWPPTHLPEERALLNCPGPIAGAKDRFGKSTCWTCWPLASADALREGKLLAQQILSGNNYSSNNSSDDNGTSNGSSTKNVNGSSSSSSSGNVSSNGHASLPPAKATAEATATAEEAVEAATIAEAVAMSIAEATAMATAEAMNNFHTDGQHPLQLMAMAATTELPDEHDQNSNNNNNDNIDNNSNTDNSQQIAPTAREAAAASNGDTDQPSGDRWSESEWKEWRRRYDSYWWTNTTQDTVSVELPAELTVGSSPSSSSTAPVAEEVISDPRLQRLCSCIQQVTGTPVAPRPNAPLHGLDSLTVALLTARLRVEFGTAGLAIARVRQAATPAELLEAVEASASALPQESAASAGNGSGQEFAVWFSPGQATPMGGWVLRNDTDMDVDRFKAAALHLVERQWSLRAQPSDPLRLLSFCLDTSVFFTLAARWMDRGSWPLRRLRLLLSWAIRSAWPKVAVRSREAVYAQKGGTPLEVVTLHDQTRAEREIRRRRNLLTQSYEPVDIALIRIEARLEGLWVFGNRGGTGDFVIFKDERLGAAGTGKLVLADRNRNEAAVLLGPADAGWLPPPYGFPALLSARIRPGTGIVWLRLRGERQISLLWKADDAPETKSRQYDAFRMPGAGGPEALSVFSFLVVHAMHNIADGLSYEAIVGDLLALYASSDPRGGSPALPPLTVNSLDLLQQRFFSAINAADPIASPQLTSLRGSQWKCQKRGYGHLIGLQRNTVAALRWAAAAYSCPFDALLLALTVIATARSAGLEEVEFTLYVPLRDGPGEASLSGLFADWRVLTVRTDVSTSTVLGVVLDVAHKLRNRQWGIYNALKKPEASMVNFQLLDAAPPSSRAGFVQIGEELWRIGENQRAETRTNEQMPWSQQPLSFVVEEGDKETWWLLISCAYDDYPPPRLRRMVQAVQDAVLALVQQPTQLVHTPYPATFY